MADDGLNIDEGAEGAEAAPPKKGLAAGFIVAILKGVAIGVGGVVLVTVIAWLVANKVSSSKAAENPVQLINDDIKPKRETLDWYSSIDEIRTKTSDKPPATVTVDIVLGYKHDDKATSTEITQRKYELIDFLRRYFTAKSMLELKPQNEGNLKIELRNAINDEILSNGKIHDVMFSKLDILEP